MQIKRFENHWWLNFDHKVSVEILTDGRDYRGLGRVKCDNSHLRSGRLPILPLIVTSDGYRVCRYSIKDVLQDEGEEKVSFLLKLHIINSHYTEQLDERGRAIFNVRQWPPEAVRDRGGALRVEIGACHTLVGSVEMRGFTYSYQFRSRKHPPYCIHDRASWEIGGRSTKNTLVQGKNVAEPYKRIVNKQDSFSTAMYQSGKPLTQFRPAATEIQPFSYQTKNDAILVTMPAGPDPFNFLVEKAESSDEIVCWRQFYKAGQSDGKTIQRTPPIRVMYGEAAMRCRAEELNRYSAVRRDLLREFAIKDAREDFEHGPAGEICVTERITLDDFEKGIQKLSNASCSQVVVSCPADGYMNKAGAPGWKAAIGRAQYQIEKILGKATTLAHRRGMQLAVLWTRGPYREEDGRISPEDCEDLSSFFKKLHTAYGIDRIYLCGDMRSLTMGSGTSEPFWHLLNKDLSRELCLLQPPAPAIMERSATRHHLIGNEFFYRNSSIRFPYDEMKKTGAAPCKMFFRGCANKLYYRTVYARRENKKYDLDRWWNGRFTCINTALKAVREHMEYPRLLPEDNGVLWSSGRDGGEIKILWTFNRFEWHAGENARVYDVMQTEKIPLEDGLFTVDPYSVYLIESAG